MFVLHRVPLLLIIPTIAVAVTDVKDPQKISGLEGVWRADFNADTTRVIVQMRSGALGLWDTTNGHPIPGDLGTLTAKGSYVKNAGATLAIVCFDAGKSRVFDLSTGSAVSPELNISIKHEIEPPAVCFSPDNSQAILFDDAGNCRIFEIQSGLEVAKLSLPPRQVEREIRPGSAFSKDGKTALIFDASATLHRYDVSTWKESGQPMPHPDRNAYYSSFSSSDDALYAVTFDSPGENGPVGSLQLWDVMKSHQIGEPLHAQNGMSGQFIDGGKRLLITPGRGDTRVVKVPSLETDFHLPRHDDVDASRAIVTADEKDILTCGCDSFVILTDALSGKLIKRYSNPAHVRNVLTGQDANIAWLVYDNSAFFNTSYADYYIVRFDLGKMQPAATLRINDFVHRSILSLDGTRLMIHVGKTDHERIRLFEAKSLKELPATADN